MDILVFIFNWIGPVLVVVSLALPSPLWFRIVNLTGSVLSAMSSWTQDVMPFVFMNTAIALINIYWLWRMAKERDYQPTLVLTNVGRDSSVLEVWDSSDSAAVKKALAANPNATINLLLTDKNVTAIAVADRGRVVWTNADETGKGKITELIAV